MKTAAAAVTALLTCRCGDRQLLLPEFGVCLYSGLSRGRGDVSLRQICLSRLRPAQNRAASRRLPDFAQFLRLDDLPGGLWRKPTLRGGLGHGCNHDGR